MPEILSQISRPPPTARLLPLLGHPDPDVVIADWRGTPIGCELFLTHVQRVAQSLAAAPFVINLCANRYLFLVTFAAAIAAGKTNLLPPGRVSRQLQEVADAYPDYQTVTDVTIEAALAGAGAGRADALPLIAAEHPAAVAFTSGSTGRARPHPKTWGSLVEGARLANARFGFDHGLPATVVATVPAQHMYGLETSILMALVCGITLHTGRPFYAGDIHAALAAASGRRILITTPVHLRVCVDSDLDWPRPEFVISATAPLSAALATRAEQRFGCPVLEIYGCTEAGSLASRRTTAGPLWRTYAGVSIRRRDATFEVCGGHLHAPVPLNDHLVLHDARRFELAGRQADMVNIAGKRASLADLTLKLNELEGVEDGVFLQPPADPDDGRTARLIALVVAPALGEKEILRRLAEAIDPAFLPRPLYRVERLPRNATGKLPHAALLELVRDLQAVRPDA